MEIWQQNDVVFDGKVVRLRTGNVLLDDGATAYREVVEHPGGACVLPFTGESFVFVRQYRIALKQYLLEAPAGKLEEDETPLCCAEKELLEETGYRAQQLISLGKVYSSAGYCNETIHLFLATGLVHLGSRPEPEERIEPVSIVFDDVRQMAADSAFDDGKTAIIVQRALNWLDKN